jgi:hypothetical protein
MVQFTSMEDVLDDPDMEVNAPLLLLELEWRQRVCTWMAFAHSRVFFLAYCSTSSKTL